MKTADARTVRTGIVAPGSEAAISSEKRAIYRVQPEDKDFLEVTLSSGGETLAPGVVVDVTVDGAGVRFALATAPNIAIGEEVELAFASQGQRILAVPARRLQRHGAHAGHPRSPSRR